MQWGFNGALRRAILEGDKIEICKVFPLKWYSFTLNKTSSVLFVSIWISLCSIQGGCYTRIFAKSTSFRTIFLYFALVYPWATNCGWLAGWLDGWMDGQADIRTDDWMGVWKYGCMDE